MNLKNVPHVQKKKMTYWFGQVDILCEIIWRDARGCIMSTMDEFNNLL